MTSLFSAGTQHLLHLNKSLKRNSKFAFRFSDFLLKNNQPKANYFFL